MRESFFLCLHKIKIEKLVPLVSGVSQKKVSLAKKLWHMMSSIAVKHNILSSILVPSMFLLEQTAEMFLSLIDETMGEETIPLHLLLNGWRHASVPQGAISWFILATETRHCDRSYQFLWICAFKLLKCNSNQPNWFIDRYNFLSHLFHLF